MIKKLKLSFFLNKSMYKQNKIAFLLYIFVQIIISVGFVFFLTTIIQARTEYVKEFTILRMIDVEVDNYYNRNQLDDIINSVKITNEYENVRILFQDESTDDKQIFQSYIYTDYANNDVIGKGITDKDIQQKEKVVVMVNDEIGDPDRESLEYEIGNSFMIQGEPFHIIGYRISTYPEIPYTIAVENMKIMEVRFQLKAHPSDNKMDSVQRFIQELLPDGNIEMPEKLNMRTLQNLMLILYSSAFVIVCAIFNFLFVFKYMIEKSSFTYNVLRLCGSSKRSLFRTILLQLVSLYIVSYTISILIFHLFIKQFVQTILVYEIIAGVFVFSIITIILIMLPYISKYSKHTIKNRLNAYKS